MARALKSSDDAKSATGPFMVIVRLTVPDHPEAHAFCPRNNHIATRLLAAYLETHLSVSNWACVCGAMLEFNRCVIVLQTPILEGFLPALCASLQSLSLLELCQVGWHDAAENVFRTWYPQQGDILVPPFQECEQGMAEFRSKLEEFNRRVAELEAET